MSIKKVLLSKKINNVIYDIFPKTSADIVTYGESTVAEALANFATGLADVYTKEETDSAVAASAEALYNRIMGITDEDGTSVKEAYDTLKEVANWIDGHGEIAAAFTNDIAALKIAVGNEESGLIKAVADLQQITADADMEITELQKAVEALEEAISGAEEGLAKRVEDLESTVDTVVELISDGETGLMSRVQKLEAKATCVTSSKTNGNIMVDGEEVTVYTHPETHSADMIVENDNRQFVTADEKAIFGAAAAITLVASHDEVVNEKDLYLVEIV